VKRRPRDRIKIDLTGDVAIPHGLLTNPEVSAVAVRLYGVLIALSCPASEFIGRRVAVAMPGAEVRDYPQWALAGACGIDDGRTIGRAITELVDLGYIAVEPGRVWRQGDAKRWRKWLPSTSRPKTYRLLPLPQ
jgi:hypothetical protein